MSQTNFFMTKEEIQGKFEELLSSGNFRFFEGRFFDSENPLQVQNCYELSEFDRVTIWINNDYSEPKCWNKGGGDYKNKFLFDFYRDPIIEFDNCKKNSKLISPGRLFYKAGWIKDDQLRLFHTKMCRKAVRVFNKKLSPISASFKISPSVKNMIEEGYEIELGNGGMRINKNNMTRITPDS